MTDHKALLTKYISYVSLAEGTDFIENGFEGFLTDEIEFTPEEWQELERISKTLREERNND